MTGGGFKQCEVPPNGASERTACSPRPTENCVITRRYAAGAPGKRAPGRRSRHRAKKEAYARPPKRRESRPGPRDRVPTIVLRRPSDRSRSIKRGTADGGWSRPAVENDAVVVDAERRCPDWPSRPVGFTRGHASKGNGRSSNRNGRGRACPLEIGEPVAHQGACLSMFTHHVADSNGSPRLPSTWSFGLGLR